ncbi:MAG: putative PEP-binding protein [Parafilimonas sp.]
MKNFLHLILEAICKKQGTIALLSWADEAAKLKVMANADTPEAAAKALQFGAVGIGLCRTERMFNASDRLPIVVEMIIANTEHEREEALQQLLPIQKKDFKEILTTMSPYPVTIRLLDPPIHEFLPTEERIERRVATPALFKRNRKWC